MSATQSERQDSKRRRKPDAAPIQPLYSTDGLATLLNVARRTVERKLSKGELPKPDIHIGRMPRWRPETIREWMAGQSGDN